jgi:hypothetical protein
MISRNRFLQGQSKALKIIRFRERSIDGYKFDTSIDRLRVIGMLRKTRKFSSESWWGIGNERRIRGKNYLTKQEYISIDKLKEQLHELDIV